MKKRLIPVLALAAASLLASCNGKPMATEYDLATHLADKEFGYVVLIGEDGNPEAQDRTKGCDDAIAKMCQEYGLTAKRLDATVSMDPSGGTWSADQAKVLMETWLTKYGDRIDFVVSNNDGMAIAATGARGLQKGTPIVGFDALKQACEMIVAGTLAGSVSQNGTDQAYATTLTLAALLGGSTDVKASLIDSYNGNATLDLEQADKHIIQTKLSAVTAENAEQLKPNVYQTPKAKVLEGKKIMYCVYNANDNFISETYAADLPHYITALGGTPSTKISGDGNNTALMEAIQNADTSTYDAFAFNIIEHSTYRKYLELVGYTFDSSGKCTQEGKPVVFYNRQPKEGNDVADLSGLKNVYFVGTGSTGQGAVQGQVITDWAKANIAPLNLK